ncbi:MAG: FprA family A-type flavoprotein [Bacilli bacterium]|nr:FprA family A-type flavoprotein [Bacilli bacterium]MBN2876543.1 FprA family A-type flavoprotein [Bacilli bacterium]
MFKKKIAEGTFMFSMNLDDILFESMWELPHGVTMNSYIVKGKDIAIIDGVIGWDGVPETLYKSLGEVDINSEDIKYLVVNHMEPDHSGWIENFRKIKTDFTLVTTAKGAEIVKAFYGEDIDIMIVKEGDSIDLGNGKTLTFHPVPNVHWPETMVTYETSTKILFTCDLFGAFGTMEEHHFDDEMTQEEVALFEQEGMRYFSNVMMTFVPLLKRAVAKTKTMDVAMVAPGHGPLYREHPEKIMNDYLGWADFANGQGNNEVTIIWGSMYGSTQKVAEYAKALLESKGIKVNFLQMPLTTESDVLTDVLRSAGVIIAAPTYEYKMFPPVAHIIDELGRKKMSGKNALYFGSFGWSAGAKKELEVILETHRMNWNFVDFIEFNGTPKEPDFKAVEQGVNALVESMQSKILK